MTNKDLTIKVVGVTFNNRQHKLRMLRDNANRAYVTFDRERNNQYDSNAMKVIAHVKGMRPFDIGYVPKEIAKTLAPVVDNDTIKVYIKNFELSACKIDGKKIITCKVNTRLYPKTKKAA